MRCLRILLAANLALLASSLTAAEGESDATRPDAAHFDKQVRPWLAQHCFKCHGEEKPKGELRLDTLAPDFAAPASADRWLKALERVETGEMPPEEEARPSKESTQAFAAWVRSQATAARQAEGRTVQRRLNRVEYENTVRDLLGVQVELQEMLPADSSAAGFDNVGEALHTSSFLMEKYLEAAEKALNLAVANGPQPPATKKRYSLKDSHQVKSTTEKVYRHLDETIVCFSSSAWNAVTLSPFYPPHRGAYRFRISAYGLQSAGKPVVYRVDAGPMLMATKNHLVSYFDASPDKPQVAEFVDHLEARSTIRILPYGLATAQAVNKIGADVYDGPGLAVEWIEIEGPLHDAWPPESHRRIFGELPQKPAPIYNFRERVEVTSDNPEVDAMNVFRRFARRAFRRSVTDKELQPFMRLFTEKLAEGRSFEQAVRVDLLGIMVSPDFLFLRETPGRLDDFALASRLSYFLWSTMPDEELLSLAERKSLSQPEVLREQVERMLNSPKAEAFTRGFVGQWLSLRDIDFTEPSHILYPEFDDMLKVSMVKETELFFAQILKEDLSVANFVASDFSMLNGRLAKHYGIPGVDGWEFRKTPLPPESHRGGMLTMASVLKVTANGTTTSPVLRGAWVLDRILGNPPPRPPADVPAIEPDIRGATTIREQLARHREDAACASCHAKIDPPGFALESFDVIGGYREFYRTSGNGKPVTIDGKRMHYLQGPKIDPADKLDTGRAFANIDEFKKHLLENKEQVARALIEKLLTYATGAVPSSVDRPQIQAIVDEMSDKDYGLRSLIHTLVQSEAFRSK